MSVNKLIHTSSRCAAVILWMIGAVTMPSIARPLKSLRPRLVHQQRLGKHETLASSKYSVPRSVPHIVTLDGSMNNPDLQSPSICEAACFAGTYSFSTVPYYSLDQPRSVTLNYNSDLASPRPILLVDVDTNDGTGV